MFLAHPHRPWKSHGTLANTPSQQTSSLGRQITLPTRFKSCLNYVIGLMPIASPAETHSAANGSAHRYRPYGLIFGVVFVVLSSGPFIAVKFLEALGIITDIAGDYALLTGLWSVLTLPFASMIYLIGGMIDAERVVKWFNL
jgi:hypothetical protein